ncbi:MAG: thioredoxin domain-containing protein [Candidatus Neomarinimicrobiota bacterium]
MNKLFFLNILSLLIWNCQNNAMTKKEIKQNRLKNSQSPYLLQHSSNPVDWYPWSDAAFKKAKKENKPIFLSIGYSTCHWCHVMEHESFEDSTVASLMNSNFINVKVDREEMPEVDHLYMSVCQAMTGRGGWPLTIIMTPEKKPFFAGTYFPKEGRGKTPGMLQLIPSLANAWKNKQSEIKNSIDKIENYLIEINTSKPGKNWNENIIKTAFSDFSSRFDSDFGGFGRAPKFPSPHNLILLLRYSKIYNDQNALKMVEITLDNMRLGGIFDHIGLGFHRYSTDRRWFLPHFEKMLYDQAMIAMAYLEAYQITKKQKYANVAEEIFTYVLRDMTDPKGGFYSAEDADSEGEEGTFYVWDKAELIEVLGQENGEKFSKIFGFIKGGNFHDEASGQTTGKNIPYFPIELDSILNKLEMSSENFNNFIKESRKKLFLKREKRIHPLKDDKILTDWNGLMIAALSQGGRILNNPEYTEAAQKSVNFMQKYLRDDNGKLFKRYRLGKSGLSPHIDDYSFMVWGLLDLYENTFEVEHLETAIELTKIMIEDFSDLTGGFYIGSKHAEKLMVRSKDSYDGALPSGNSVAAMNLFRLSKITGDIYWEKLAEKTLRAFTGQAEKSPSGFSHMLTAFIFNLKFPKELVIVAEKNDSEIRNFINSVQNVYSPNKVIILKTRSTSNKLNKLAPWLKNHEMINNKPTFYLCENFSCKQPTTNIDTILNYLNEDNSF